MEQVMTCRSPGSSSSAMKREETNNLQFSDILESALRRSTESVVFFEKKAETSRRIVNRAFFLYLSAKKDAQLTVLKKIAYSFGLEKALSRKAEGCHDDLELNENNADEDYRDIFKAIHEIAADELEYYINYATLENNQKIKSFILMLADLAKEFLFDVKIWYLNHKDAACSLNTGLQETPAPGYIVEAILN